MIPITFGNIENTMCVNAC